MVIPPAWVSGKSPTVFCSDEFGGTKIGRSRWERGVHWAVFGPRRIARVIRYVDCAGARWVGNEGLVCIT